MQRKRDPRRIHRTEVAVIPPAVLAALLGHRETTAAGRRAVNSCRRPGSTGESPGSAHENVTTSTRNDTTISNKGTLSAGRRLTRVHHDSAMNSVFNGQRLHAGRTQHAV